jgi:hypothetical protein
LKDFKLIATTNEHGNCSQRKEMDRLIMAVFIGGRRGNNHIKEAAPRQYSLGVDVPQD